MVEKGSAPPAESAETDPSGETSQESVLGGEPEPTILSHEEFVARRRKRRGERKPGEIVHVTPPLNDPDSVLRKRPLWP